VHTLLGKTRQNENTDAQNIRVFTSGLISILRKPRVLSFKVAMATENGKNRFSPHVLPFAKSFGVGRDFRTFGLKFRARPRAVPETPSSFPGERIYMTS